eukprot:GHVS01027926.1.p1 GENE.GHVS01027926.1~~GHVS01027926.1.p1  ORF type:complete len:1722 (-),score=286.73 GHVS01027926.1:175-5340(-)
MSATTSKYLHNLPIQSLRQSLLDSISSNYLTCVEGGAATGKSLGIPLFLLHQHRRRLEEPSSSSDADFALVVVEPSTLACHRLATQLALELGELVGGHTVALGCCTSNRRAAAAITVTTAANLVKTLLLKDAVRYSHILLDEAHWRCLQLDMLCLLIKLEQHHHSRPKIVVMSTTLQANIFSEYFCGHDEELTSVTMRVPEEVSSGFPVHQLWLDDLLKPTSELSRLHPIVADLCFRCQEGRYLLDEATHAALAQNFQSCLESASEESRGETGEEGDDSLLEAADGGSSMLSARPNPQLLAAMLPGIGSACCVEVVRRLLRGGESAVIFLPSVDAAADVYSRFRRLIKSTDLVKYKLLVLHSMLSPDNEQAVFEVPAEDCCHVILSCFADEGGLVFPRVRVVIDFVLKENSIFDRSRHSSSTEWTWTSKARAARRSAKAGRCFPGVYLQLLWRHVYESFVEEHDPSEVQDMPLEQAYLEAKLLSSSLNSASQNTPSETIKSPKSPKSTTAEGSTLDSRCCRTAVSTVQVLQMLITPPHLEALSGALKRMDELGALTGDFGEAKITALGYLMLHLPVDAKLCRLILFGLLFGLTGDAVVIAAALSCQDPFTAPQVENFASASDYAEAVRRSSESRTKFDEGSYSEPIMLRNLFSQWFTSFARQVCSSCCGGANNLDIKEALSTSTRDFSHSAAVVPHRLLKVALCTMKLATSLMQVLPKGTRAWKALEVLTGVLQYTNLFELPPSLLVVIQQEESLFSHDALLLKALITSSFSPLFLAGSPEVCVDGATGELPPLPDETSELDAKFGSEMLAYMGTRGFDPSTTIALSFPQSLCRERTLVQHAIANALPDQVYDLYIDDDKKFVFIVFPQDPNETDGDALSSLESDHSLLSASTSVETPVHQHMEVRNVPLVARLLNQFRNTNGTLSLPVDPSASSPKGSSVPYPVKKTKYVERSSDRPSSNESGRSCLEVSRIINPFVVHWTPLSASSALMGAGGRRAVDQAEQTPSVQKSGGRHSRKRKSKTSAVGNYRNPIAFLCDCPRLSADGRVYVQPKQVFAVAEHLRSTVSSPEQWEAEGVTLLPRRMAGVLLLAFLRHKYTVELQYVVRVKGADVTGLRLFQSNQYYKVPFFRGGPGISLSDLVRINSVRAKMSSLMDKATLAFSAGDWVESLTPAQFDLDEDLSLQKSVLDLLRCCDVPLPWRPATADCNGLPQASSRAYYVEPAVASKGGDASMKVTADLMTERLLLSEDLSPLTPDSYWGYGADLLRNYESSWQKTPRSQQQALEAKLEQQKNGGGGILQFSFESVNAFDRRSVLAAPQHSYFAPYELKSIGEKVFALRLRHIEEAQIERDKQTEKLKRQMVFQENVRHRRQHPGRLGPRPNRHLHEPRYGQPRDAFGPPTTSRNGSSSSSSTSSQRPYTFGPRLDIHSFRGLSQLTPDIVSARSAISMPAWNCNSPMGTDMMQSDALYSPGAGGISSPAFSVATLDEFPQTAYYPVQYPYHPQPYGFVTQGPVSPSSWDTPTFMAGGYNSMDVINGGQTEEPRVLPTEMTPTGSEGGDTVVSERSDEKSGQQQLKRRKPRAAGRRVSIQEPPKQVTTKQRSSSDSAVLPVRAAVQARRNSSSSVDETKSVGDYDSDGVAEVVQKLQQQQLMSVAAAAALAAGLGRGEVEQQEERKGYSGGWGTAAPDDRPSMFLQSLSSGDMLQKHLRRMHEYQGQPYED